MSAFTQSSHSTISPTSKIQHLTSKACLSLPTTMLSSPFLVLALAALAQNTIALPQPEGQEPPPNPTSCKRTVTDFAGVTATGVYTIQPAINEFCICDNTLMAGIKVVTTTLQGVPWRISECALPTPFTVDAVRIWGPVTFTTPSYIKSRRGLLPAPTPSP